MIINLETMQSAVRPRSATENYCAGVAAGTAMRISHSNNTRKHEIFMNTKQLDTVFSAHVLCTTKYFH